ncbi:MAG: aminoglycoside phosphotransferase family protein [Cyclobacteriaceae bacterium]|nr:aminoglycoside phosphotransferase family protein [Cyclobacteriaceae bacterium]
MELDNAIIDFFFPGKSCDSIEAISSGHINSTYKISLEGKEYILQNINTHVFDPIQLSKNIEVVTQHLKNKDYQYRILTPFVPENRTPHFEYQGEYWRIFEFIDHTETFEKAKNAKQAYKAALAFSDFIKSLNDLDHSAVKPALPGFMDFRGRFTNMQKAIEQNPVLRKQEMSEEIDYLVREYKNWSSFFDFIEDCPWHVIHADAKISNLLFNKNTGDPECIIDLDTLMPGPVVYDFSEMVRSYTNLENEDSVNISPAIMSWEILEELIRGFSEGIGSILTEKEWLSLEKGAAFVTYIQAVRFLTDYVNGDIYYKVKYPRHNYDRTINQIALYKAIISKSEEISRLFKKLREQI